MGRGWGWGGQEPSTRQATAHQKGFPRNQIPSSYSPIPPGDSEEVSGAQTTLEDAPTQRNTTASCWPGLRFPPALSQMGQRRRSRGWLSTGANRPRESSPVGTISPHPEAGSAPYFAGLRPKGNAGPCSQCIENRKAAATGQETEPRVFRREGSA